MMYSFLVCKMPFPHSPSSFVTSSPEFKESPLLLMDLLTVESALHVTRDLQLLLVEIFKMHGIFFTTFRPI